MTGLPGFLREGFLPLGAFYGGLRLDGLAAGIVAAALASVLIYIYERRAGRDALLVRISLGFVVVQSIVGLAANSATVYLAQPVLLAAAWGLAFWVSIPLGRPLAGALACAWYPFPPLAQGELGLQACLRGRVGRLGRILPRPQRAAVRPAPGGEPRDLPGGRLPHWNAGDARAARVVGPIRDPRPGGCRAACLTPSGRVATVVGEHTFVPANNLPRCPRC